MPLASSLLLETWSLRLFAKIQTFQSKVQKALDNGSEIPDSRMEIREQRFEVRDSRFKIRESKFKNRDSRSEIWDSRVEIRDSRSENRYTTVQLRSLQDLLLVSDKSLDVWWWYPAYPITLVAQGSPLPGRWCRIAHVVPWTDPSNSKQTFFQILLGVICHGTW